MNLLKDDQLQFFPGIFQKSDIKEDEVVFSDEYSLKLGSVRANAKGGSLLGQKLLKHYDWTKLENIILKHLGKYLWIICKIVLIVLDFFDDLEILQLCTIID